MLLESSRIWRYISRYIHFIGFHHVLIVINLVPIIAWSLLLAGCISPNGLRNVYLFALSYKTAPAPTSSDPLLINTNITQVLGNQILESHKIVQEVRVGYLSVCIAFNSGTWSCSTRAQELATSLRSEGIGDPLNLLRLGERVRTGTFFYGLLFVFLTTCMLFTLPAWGEEDEGEGSESRVKPNPSYRKLDALLILNAVATFFGLASALWQHIGGAGASTLTRLTTYELVISRVGTTGIALGWLAAGLTSIVTLGIILIKVSMRIIVQYQMD
ncbi:hypothetical protein HD806DRAFT_520657 [Xylariaceae sp. AK1471]|nr:hypothetical protein HD806DRAFT_520657 [Xylariaceae sp. AK1471]